MKKITVIIAGLSGSFGVFGQSTAEPFKVIPDKIFETAVPLIFIFLVLNLIVSYFKHHSENKIKQLMIERGISEEGLIQIFKDANDLKKSLPLKWFLFCLVNGLAILILFLNRHHISDSSGYFAIAVILISNAIASISYYYFISKKR